MGSAGLVDSKAKVEWMRSWERVWRVSVGREGAGVGGQKGEGWEREGGGALRGGGRAADGSWLCPSCRRRR